MKKRAEADLRTSRVVVREILCQTAFPDTNGTVNFSKFPRHRKKETSDNGLINV